MGNCCVPPSKPVNTNASNSNGPGSPLPYTVEFKTANHPIHPNDINIGIKRPIPDVPFQSHRSPSPIVMILKQVKALYDYTPRTPDDLEFRKGDILEVLEIDSDNSDWWKARHKGKTNTNDIGYIPSNYVADDDATKAESYDWYFEIDRREAERQLHWAGNQTGTFLIRLAADKKSYAISVRDFNVEKQEVSIKHYKIRKMDNNGVYIAARRPFNTIVDLVKHYSEQSDGLCCKLGKACPKEPEIVPFKEIEVVKSEVKILEKLGHGNFGEVFKGKFRGTIDVAIKCLKQGTMSPEAFLGEAKIMHKLRHKKLVQLMGVCSNEQPIYIITELMVHGALLDYLREKKMLPFKTIVDMSAQIADGMKYLESKNFVHRDLRAANILVGKNDLVKVADFGLAKVVKVQNNSLNDEDENVNDKQDESTKFPIKWTAPEAAYQREFSTKSDVWSFGILLYEMITFGRVPYPGMTGNEVLRRLEEGYRMPKPVANTFVCPDLYYEVMLKCWDKNPESRPTFEYLYNHFDDFAIASESSYKEPL